MSQLQIKASPGKGRITGRRLDITELFVIFEKDSVRLGSQVFCGLMEVRAAFAC